MRLQSKRASAFSLVEMVIVVVIIGLIAAIAVPRISRGAKGATESSIKGSLAGLRAAIDLYAAEHNGVFPGKTKADGTAGNGDDTDFAKQLTTYSDSDGKTGAYDASSGTVYGPYLRSGVPALPVGPPDEATTVTFDDVNSPPTPTNVGGWIYNPNTGEIRANTDVTDEAGNNFSDY